MIDTHKLKVVLFDKNVTYEQAAEAIGISRQAFNDRVNKGVDFKHLETIRLADFLGLSNAEYCDIFCQKT